MTRLPTVGADGNAWGTVLNDFLSVAHNSDGTLKAFVNVADFGVAPGTAAATNDTNMANAIAALPSNGPGVLLFPVTGTAVYNFTQPIVIDRDYVTLFSWGATLAVDASADPSYLLIVGNTKNVQQCRIEGLYFQGRASTSSTGAGINFRSNGGTIKEVRVSQFGGTGINVAAFSGTIFQVLLEDVWLIQNGYNASHTNDNLVLNSGVSDCEYIRVISYGDVAKTTTRNGINNNGGQQKLTQCHAYFCSNDGFYNTGSGTQVIGGEWETNGNNGIESNAPGLIVASISAFGNVATDVAAYGQSSITGNSLTSVCTQNIYVNSPNGGVLADNVCSGASTAIAMDTGTSLYSVHDNQLAATGGNAIFTKTTNSSIHDNTCTTGTITEATGANGNDIHDNIVPSAITIVGATTKVRNNPGFNPQGVAAITVTASPFTYTAGATPETVYISGGTVSVVAKNSITLFTATNCNVNLEPHEAVVVTYSSAPTMNKDRH